jgi:hypothetical protein
MSCLSRDWLGEMATGVSENACGGDGEVKDRDLKLLAEETLHIGDEKQKNTLCVGSSGTEAAARDESGVGKV